MSCGCLLCFLVSGFPYTYTCIYYTIEPLYKEHSKGSEINTTSRENTSGDGGGQHEFAGGMICHEPAGQVADHSAGERVPSELSLEAFLSDVLYLSHDALNNIQGKMS